MRERDRMNEMMEKFWRKFEVRNKANYNPKNPEKSL